MIRALAALLTHAIDYAGVFPPAKLDLATAYQEYIRYRKGPEAWILGKFAVRSVQLGEFSELLSYQKPAHPVSVTVIGRGGADRKAWEAALELDAKDLNEFQGSTKGFAELEAYEVRLPNNAEAEAFIRDLHGFSASDVFAELPWDANQLDALAAVAEADFLQAKERLGGETAAAFPSSAQVATFIQGAIQLDVPFKLTAGLHHATPFHDTSVGARMHGFLNVYAATAFSIEHDLTVRELERVLDCDDERAFVLTDRGLDALGWSVTMETLEEAREYFVGFGSCSIQEPLDTLRTAGYPYN